MVARLRIATAIDIGTNTLLALTGQRGGDGRIVRLADRASITGLGRGVDRTGRLGDDAMQRALGALREFVDEARSLGSERIDAVGTSAVRDAANRDEFVRAAGDITGGPVEVATGEREASLTFAGAIEGIAVEPNTEILAFDVGGGSTELIVGAAGASPRWRVSIDVGSVRLTERLGLVDDPVGQRLDDLRMVIDSSLPRTLPPHERVVGLAATVLTVACVARSISFERAREAVGLEITRDEVSAVLSSLSTRSTAERSQSIGVDPRRGDVIVAGAAIVERVLLRSSRDRMVVSDGGVRVGLLREMFAGPCAR